MKKFFLVLLLALTPAVLCAQEILEKIDIVGNERITRETITYYLSSREGGFFSEDQVRRDFRVLWSTGFFSDIKVEQTSGSRGVVLKFTVEENPMVRSIVYKTGKRLKENDIVSKLKEKDQNVLAYSYYSPYKLQKIKDTINDLLSEKGLLAAKVETELRKQGKNDVEVLIRIDEGPKVRVGDVAFEGITKLPASDLVWAMKDNRPHTLFNWIAGKDVYKQNKVKDDIDGIKKKFQEHGYMEATVGPARVEPISGRTILGKKQQMMRLVIPVNPGYLYRAGEVKIEGNKAFKGPGVRMMVKIQKGDIYSTKAREKAIKDIGELYQNFGYIYAQIVPVENLDPKNKVVNVTFNVYENEIAYLHRLEFRGNNYTKDKVIRREMLLREGDRFSLAMFKDSVLRIKQLGLVEVDKDPDIKPSADDPTKMDVTVNVREMQRNNLQFTAGYSGYEGTFIAFSYSTVNFLGAGENLDFTAQTGKRVRNFSFGFTEPYIFDQPLTTGFNIYDRYINYPQLYNQTTRGVDFTLGARILGYWRANVTYTIQFINAGYPEGSPADPSSSNYDPTYSTLFYGTGTFHEDSITPTIYRSTIDSPLTPSRGTSYSASLKYAGSFFGGDINLVKPSLDFAHYQPFVANHTIGIHVQYQYLKALNDSKVPYWEKFYLGGERSIRGYEVYSIGPRTASGGILGGDKSLVLNAEYIIPVGGPLYAIFFYDVGNTVLYSEKFLWKDMYSSTGFEARVFVPALRVPFRLIFAYNNKKIFTDTSNFAFRFAVGTTF